EAAIEAYRRGLREDPLSARLYYSLSVALTRSGDCEGARQALELASKIDPQFVRQQDASQ
ncbi:MAG: tetratricopeptide repeat protein, partial [Bryobacteraceae bacterium]